MNNNGILLLFVSDYKEKSEEKEEYIFSEGKKYIGRQTNEAPCKYLVDKANEEGSPITNIICILSNEVKNEIVKDGKTSYKIFCDRIKEYIGNDSDITFHDIRYIMDDEYTCDDMYDNTRPQNSMAVNIYIELENIISKIGKSTVYIDFTGGMRDVTFLMTTLVRYMEVTGIQCGGVAYSQYTDKKIVDITYIYNIFKLINAVNEFASTGNAKALRTFSTGIKLVETTRLMESIIKLADDISLCRINNIEKEFTEIKAALDELSTMKIEDDNYEKKLYFQMIQLLIPMIKRKMYISEKIQIINIIRWCIDNSLIQQAITLYVEKMPEYYLEIGVFERTKAMVRKSAAEAFYENFYNDVYNKMLPPDEQRKTAFIEFLKEVLEEYKDRNFSKDSLMKLDKNKCFQKQIDRIICINDRRYVQKNNAYFVYGKEIKEKNIYNFLKSASNNSPEYLHYLLYNDKEAYDKSKLRKELKTYMKKYKGAEVAEKLSESISPVIPDNAVISKVLFYYLAIKIIRNNLNHASSIDSSENKIDSSMEEVISLLGDRGIVINDSIDSISRILKSGIGICI